MLGWGHLIKGDFMRILAAAFGILAAQALAAEQDFVTDLALCPLDPIERHEKGLSFDGQFVTEIEWLCEMETPLPQVTWTKDQTFFRMGYCNEPGAVFPGVLCLWSLNITRGNCRCITGTVASRRSFIFANNRIPVDVAMY